MRMKNILLLCLIVLLLAIPANINVSMASTTTRLYVDPAGSSAPIDSTISINVNVENVTELYGWSCNLTFRADVLQVWIGGLAFSTWMQTESGSIAFPLINYDNTAGFIVLGQILHPSATSGASGNGTLVTVTFNVTSVGASYLDLIKSKLNSKIGGNNVPIPHTAEDGLFDNRLVVLPPVAKIIAPTSGVAGELLTFDASESNDTADNGWIVSYEWDFSLGQAFNVEATGKTITHSFGSKGSYTVGLRVTDNDGLTDTATLSITIVSQATYFPRLAGKKAWTRHHFVEAKHGEINVLYARVKNPNDALTFDVYVRFTAYDAKYGMVEGSVDSLTVPLVPGNQTDVTAEFNITDPEFQHISKAYIKAELFYFDGEDLVKAPLAKWFSFVIVRSL